MGGTDSRPKKDVRWLWPALALLAATAALLAARIAGQIAEGGAIASDRAILLALRRPDDPSQPIGPMWLRQSAIDVSALGGYTLLWIFGVAGVGYLALRRRRAEAAWLGAALAGAAVIDSLLKGLFHRARPDAGLHLAYVSSASFPSAHAMISAAVYLSLGLMLAETDPRPVGRVCLLAFMCLIVILIGCSRVYLGVHWPSDVVAGWCLGTVWALLVFAASRWPRRNARRI